MKKRLLSLLLSALMVLALFPAGTAANGTEFESAAGTAERAEATAAPELKDQGDAVTMNEIFSEDFESDPQNHGWTFMDNDGDGYTWK